MRIELKSLIAIEELKNDPDKILDLVDNSGQAVLLKNNKPAFIIVKYEEEKESEFGQLIEDQKYNVLKLHEAMEIVLEEQDDKQLHAADLADIIFNRGLYRKKDGTKAMANQIRARCEKYPNLFTSAEGNIIILRAKEPNNTGKTDSKKPRKTVIID